MHLKLTYTTDGTIDIDFSAQAMHGEDVSKLIDKLQTQARSIGTVLVVERLRPGGAPLQDPEVLK